MKILPCQRLGCDGNAISSPGRFRGGEDALKTNQTLYGSGVPHPATLLTAALAAASLTAKYSFSTLYQCSKCNYMWREWFDGEVKDRWKRWL